MSGAGITLAGLGLPAADLAAAGLAPDAPVAGLTADSRQVKPGWVFFCPGFTCTASLPCSSGVHVSFAAKQ